MLIGNFTKGQIGSMNSTEQLNPPVPLVIAYSEILADLSQLRQSLQLMP